MNRLVVNTTGSFRVGTGEQWRTQALVVVPLVDEWTTRTPSQVLAMSLSQRTSAHVTGGHLVVTGIPELAMPTLATLPQVVRVRLTVPGRRSQDAEITVPMGASLPFTAPALAVDGPVVSLAGTVQRAAFPYTPIGNATVTLAGPAGTPLVAASLPLTRPHVAGTTIQTRTLTDGAATSLTQPASAGDRVVRLASTAGLAAGTVLRLAQDFVVVASVLTDGVAELRTPLAASAASGSVVTTMTLGAVGATTTLRRDARPTDGVLACVAPLTGTHVEIVDGTDTEYRSTQIVTDSLDGTWRVSGVRGVPDITLTTSAAGFVTDTRAHPLTPATDPIVLTTALRT